MVEASSNLLIDAPEHAQSRAQAIRRSLWIAGAVIVIVLIGSSVAWLTVTARQRASDAQRLAAVSRIQSAIFRYSVDHASYPDGQELVLGEGGSCNNQACAVLGQQGFTGVGGDNDYLAPIPGDGLASSGFVYTQLQDGASYQMSFRLVRGAAGYPAGTYQLSPSGLSLVQ